VFAFADLTLGLTSLAVVEPDLPVCTNADQVGAIRTELNPVNVVGMLVGNSHVELEGRSMVEDCLAVITSSGSTQRSLLPDRHSVELLRVAVDLANSVSAVPCDAMSVSLLAVADSNNALRVTVPG
jgi:hypothetical protein